MAASIRPLVFKEVPWIYTAGNCSMRLTMRFGIVRGYIVGRPISKGLSRREANPSIQKRAASLSVYLNA